MSDERMDYYVRGYLDALDTMEIFRDLPIDVVVKRSRERIAENAPDSVKRVRPEPTGYVKESPGAPMLKQLVPERPYTNLR